MNVFISTFPFCHLDPKPVNLLREAGVNFSINPLGRKLKESELPQFLKNVDILIAGTENISKQVIDSAPNLKLISRVGVGLDSVNLHVARERGIKICYTPDAPAPAVAELTIATMLTLLRSIHIANNCMHLGEWKRFFGGRIGNSTIGIIGYGRIGSKVFQILQGFKPRKILIHDHKFNDDYQVEGFEKSTLDQIYRESDLITLHLPLTDSTRNLISAKEFSLMRSNALLINTARGGIVNEIDLYKALETKQIAGASIDVFEEEPYVGNLNLLENCLLTSHMGSMSFDCRAAMELEATLDAINFYLGQPLNNEVPNFEFLNQQR